MPQARSELAGAGISLPRLILEEEAERKRLDRGDAPPPEAAVSEADDGSAVEQAAPQVAFLMMVLSVAVGKPDS